ncbi:hypothetical protein ACJZ2D_010347 [Fusarium nematophilum]
MEGQPIGPPAPPGSASLPSKTTLNGQNTALAPLDKAHTSALWKHLGGYDKGHLWTYMLSGPFLIEKEWSDYINKGAESTDPYVYTIFSGPCSDPDAEPAGMMSFMNITPGQRRIEIGSIILSEQLQRTCAATESFYLILKYAFENLGYLRVEWKANRLNKPSLSAAARLGFVFEGIFRKHMIIKGRHRDTAWFSITNDEWPGVKQALEIWLNRDNFDCDGKQIKSLQDVRSGLGQVSE